MPTHIYGNRTDFMAAVDALLDQQLPSIADDATPVLLEVEATPYPRIKPRRLRSRGSTRRKKCGA
jgi:hypothetical protein